MSPNTLEIYQQVMNNALQRTGPIVECYEVEGTRERRVVIGYKQGTVKSYFSAMSNLYHFYVSRREWSDFSSPFGKEELTCSLYDLQGLYSARKYVEQFSNGYTIMSLYLNPLRYASRHLERRTRRPRVWG